MIVETDKPEIPVPPVASVSLVVDYDSADDLVLDYTANLATGSVFLNTARQIAVGAPVHLTLQFPGLLKPIGISGTVRWEQGENQRGGAGIGIELGSQAERDHLRTMVERVRDRDPAVVTRLIRVLVVEDNPHVAHLIRNGLHGTGRREFHDDLAFNFRTASNGRDAMALLHAERFDVVIVDIYLPIMDGAHVIAQVRGNEGLRRLPVIAVSAGGKAAQDAALDAGADVFLEKPMRLRQLVDAMRGLIDLS